LKLNDVFLYRNAADKVSLALVIAINAYIKAVEGFFELLFRVVENLSCKLKARRDHPFNRRLPNTPI